jgi:hypothetical protein
MVALIYSIGRLTNPGFCRSYSNSTRKNILRQWSFFFISTNVSDKRHKAKQAASKPNIGDERFSSLY